MSDEIEMNQPSDGDPVDPVEAEARAGGWRPQDEFLEAGGDPRKWCGPSEFLFRGELMSRITSLGRKVNSLEGDKERLTANVKASLKMAQEMADKAYQKALKDAKAQHRAALREGDYDAADAMEEQIDEMKSAHEQSKKEMADDAANTDQVSVAQQIDPAKLPPIARTWLQIVADTPELQDRNRYNEVASQIDPILEANPNMGTREFVKLVDSVLEGEAPVRGVAGPTHNTGNRTSTKGPSGNRGGTTMKDLSDFEKNVVNTWISMGTYEDTPEGRKAAIKDVVDAR